MKHKWKTHKKNCQLREGALHPGISSRDITEQLDSKEGGGGGLVTSSRQQFCTHKSQRNGGIIDLWSPPCVWVISAQPLIP